MGALQKMKLLSTKKMYKILGVVLLTENEGIVHEEKVSDTRRISSNFGPMN